MTVLHEFVLFDCLSERIVQSFFCPNERYAKKQVDLFLKRNPDCDKKDFKLFIYDSLNVPDNYEDLMTGELSKEISLDE